VNPYTLHESESYRNASPEERAAICNGAGAKDGIGFPNTFYGLDMTEVFHNHDWDYHHGKTKEDKDNADRYMFFNLLIVIEAQTSIAGRLLKPLRRRRALKYYEAVCTFGADAFWADKAYRP